MRADCETNAGHAHGCLQGGMSDPSTLKSTISWRAGRDRQDVWPRQLINAGGRDERCRHPPLRFSMTPRGVSRRGVGAIDASPFCSWAAMCQPTLRQYASVDRLREVEHTLGVHLEGRAAAEAPAHEPSLRCEAGGYVTSTCPGKTPNE